MNEKISVVVPIYNVEEYLPKCLDSIIGQTYKNIEIILVDDGSPDGSGAICDDYAKQDARILAYHISNGGVAKARQLGVENATGEYIVFVDPDDWLPFDSIEILYSNISEDVDLVIGSRVIHRSNIVEEIPLTPRTLDTEQYLNLLLPLEIPIVPWGKIYRQHLFNKDSFPNVKHTQDLLMNLEIGFRVRGVKIIDNLIYNYLVRETSSCGVNKDTFKSSKNLVEVIREILIKNSALTRYILPYAKGGLSLFFRPIKSGNIVNNNDPFLQSFYKDIASVKLPRKHRIILYILRTPTLQLIARKLFTIKRKRQ